MKKNFSLFLSFSVLLVVAGWMTPFSSANADDSDLIEIADAISATFEAHHYNPAELQTPGYRDIDAAMHHLAETSETVDQFVAGFSGLWSEGPFSHVRLAPSRFTAEETAAYLDALAIGGGGAVLTWQERVAILTVNTMMGTDTIEEIEAAYAEITEQGASALIVDLRNNEGGAFAVKPLVEHVLMEPVDAGVFVSQSWNSQMDRAPGRRDLEGVDPWQGWSIRDFWNDAQTNRLTRIQFSPADDVFTGPVYVLVSNRTASAAELAADTFASSGRATLIGETTAGAMLSQKMYDLPGGLQLSLPIADYYSIEHGRIEGVGVSPDISVPAADALDHALMQIE